MSTELLPKKKYPGGLRNWAGHRAGGVRRLFDAGSGRPSGAVIRTQLLSRLTDWVDSLVRAVPTTPKVVLLVGGPGNGKTEAVEATLTYLDHQLGLAGGLIAPLSRLFSPAEGESVPRLASIDLATITSNRFGSKLHIVQDASVSDSNSPGITPAELLLNEIEAAQTSPAMIYLSCVNRGVLDDALILAIEGNREETRALLETIVRAVGLSPSGPSCWPLEGHEHVAIWPMDVESLFVGFEDGALSPAAQTLDAATCTDEWPTWSQCAAGTKCPFCTSRRLLESKSNRESFLRVMRWYELATGKRWSFRDLFSLVSYMLAGEPVPDGFPQDEPCAWAEKLAELGSRTSGKADSLRLRAPYLLVAAQYQHAMFGQWPRSVAKELRRDLRELGLDQDPTLLGLCHFLNTERGRSVPATLRPQLEGLCEALDPALTDPDEEVAINSNTVVKLRDIDARFSQSVGEGLDFLRNHKCLSALEIDLLSRLSLVDALLASAELRKRRTSAATRVQAAVRDFSCRLARRSLGARLGFVSEVDTLRRYEKVVDGDTSLLHEAVTQVAHLLNSDDRFVVTLNTTFGEPLPPEPRRAVLTTDRQRVRPLHQQQAGRPRHAMKFLAVGSTTDSQSIPLTFDLFRSVGSLRAGMLQASLPRAVVALLDTTKAQLSGRIVRNEELLDGAELRIGLRDDVVVRQMQQFVVRVDKAT